MKKILALVLVSALCLTLLAGCGPNADETPTTSPDASTPGAVMENPDADAKSDIAEEINLGETTDPTDLGPWAGNMGGATALIPLVYQAMFIKELDGDLEPCLGKTLTQVDDLVYDVELFDYIYDSAGNPLTADDVVFSFNSAKEIGKVAGVKVCESIEKTGDYSVRVTFSDSVRAGDIEGFWGTLFIVTQAAYEASPDQMATTPVGTAQYELAEYTSGSLISFVLRDDYWQNDEQYIARSSQAHVKTVNFWIVTEAAQRATGLQEGTLDYAAVSYTDLPAIEALDGYHVTEVPDNASICLMPNVSETSPTSDLRVRQAVFYAIDREGVAAAYSSGAAIPIYDMSNSNYPDYYEAEYAASAAGNYYTCDPDKAVELLREAGYNDGDLTLRLICSSAQKYVEIATIIEAYLNAVGINVDVTSYQSSLISTYAEDSAGWDLYLIDYASTDYAVNVWDKFFTGTKYSWGGTINFIMGDELQDLLSNVRSIDGHTKENVIAFHDYIVENAYGFGLVQTINYFGTSDMIKDVVFSEKRLIRPNASIYSVE